MFYNWKQNKLHYLSTYMDPSKEPVSTEKHLSPLVKRPMPHATILERCRPQRMRHARINDLDHKQRHGKLFEKSKMQMCKILSNNDYESYLI